MKILIMNYLMLINCLVTVLLLYGLCNLFLVSQSKFYLFTYKSVGAVTFVFKINQKQFLCSF